MLLTISTTRRPATDLGFVLRKHPDAVRTVELPFGLAHVFYPEATEDRCTAALLVEVDPIGLVRGRRDRAPEPSLMEYVNDRPYVASSFLSVAIAKLFGSAMSGASAERPDLAEAHFPLELSLPVVACRGDRALVHRLFEPLGYAVSAEPIPLDPRFPEWGDSRYVSLRLAGEARVSDALAHLYVLLPVLDDEKHYWVARDEIEKLLRRGGTWLAAHPERELITQRYLRYRTTLTREALARLVEEDQPDPDAVTEERDREEARVEEKVGLNEQRQGAVLAALRASGARTVVDLGCGEGRLLRAVVADRAFERILGVDVSAATLERAASRLRLEELSPRARERVSLLQGSLTYRDRRLEGFDAATVVEVIEHLDPPRLPAFEEAVFGTARPGTVVLTTPNVEYNGRFPSLPDGAPRHRDHRFEWTRAEFRAWADRVAVEHGYAVRFVPVGPDDPEVGPPTQMAVFSR